MLWVEKSAQLWNQTLLLGMLLHFRSVWCGKDSVTLPKELLDKFQIHGGVKQRTLKSMEKAGLVSIVQETGHSTFDYFAQGVTVSKIAIFISKNGLNQSLFIYYFVELIYWKLGRGCTQ